MTAQPVINSINPASGPIGTNVIISGNNFSPTPGNNTVFFGAVKAQVISASATSLTVVAPAGANNKPITVTTNGLTAYSDKSFFITFVDAGGQITRHSFDTTDFYETDLHPNDITVNDFDGDGKPDIATSNNYSITGSPSSFSVLRNITTGETITMDTRIDFENGVLTYAITSGDVDGDGKPDIVVSSIGDQSITVYRNTSSTGNISFATGVSYSTSENPYSIVIRDFDLDGKPDIAVANYVGGNVAIFKNVGTVGNIIFNSPINLTTGLGPFSICAADIDNDGKPDLAVTNELANSVSVFRNIGSVGTISFTPKTDYTTGAAPKSVAMGDLNFDNYPDLVVVGGSNITIFQNSGSGGVFSSGTITTSGINLKHVTIADLNGDTKNDLLISANGVMLNNGSGGAISLAPSQSLYLPGDGFSAEIVDLNADGWPDISRALPNQDKVSVHQNRINKPTITGLSHYTVPEGNTVIITGINLSNVSSVSFGGLPAASFTIVNATTIHAVVGQGFSGDVKVTNNYGSHSLPGFIFAGPPVVSSFSPTSAGYGEMVTINGHNFTSNPSVNFGGSPVTYNVISSTTIIATLGSGSTGSVNVTNDYGTTSATGFTYLPKPVINSFTPNYGGQGQTITINGFNFNGTTSVKFGGVEAQSFSIVSPTVITAVIGNGATGNIEITNSAGTGIKSGFTFIPPPIITSFTPTEGIAGTVVTVTGENFLYITEVKVGNVYYTGMINYISSTQFSIPVTNGNSGSISVTTIGGSTSMPGFIFYRKPLVSSIHMPVGNEGIEVVITGDNFQGSTSVTLGGVPLSSFTVTSPTTITGIIGNGASGFVVVTNPAGQNLQNVQFSYITAPLITNFTPRSGPPGTLVTITGGGFNSIPQDNIIYFGKVKANVISSSLNQVIAEVPYGADYDGISITNVSTSKTGYSDLPFNITFPVDPDAFHANSFSGLTTLPTGVNPYQVTHGDLDGDGKNDLIVTYSDDVKITVFRNLSSGAQIAFAPGIDFPVTLGIDNIELADFDNDGKLDIFGIKHGYSSLYKYNILKNTSLAGTISFAPYVEVTTVQRLNVVVAFDLDKDGRIDIATACMGCQMGSGASSIGIFRNLSSGGTISFQEVIEYLGTQEPSSSAFFTNIVARDINGDKYEDLILGTTANFFFIFKNRGGSLNPVRIGPDQTISNGKLNAIVADFDNDGLPDVTTDHHIHKNTGELTFNTTPSTNVGAGITVDLNGDNKVDIFHRNGPSSPATIRKNISTGSSINLAPSVSYPAAMFFYPDANDIDNDGRPDLIYVNRSENKIGIIKNTSGEAIVCEGGNTSINYSHVTGTSYQWQLNDGSGFIDLANNSNFNNVTSPVLQLMNVPISWQGYIFRCIVDGNAGSNFILVVRPSVTPEVTITASNSTACEGSPVTFNAAHVNGGTPVYQWQVNGINSGNNSPVFTTSSLQNNSEVRVIMTSTQLGCLTSNIDTSNVISVSITPIADPSVSITGDQSICTGQAATFTASAINGGTTPVYQWKINGINAGSNNAVFSTTSLSNNDVVSVTLTSSETCVTTQTVNSLPLTVNVAPMVSPSVAITSSATSICLGSPVSFSASATFGGIAPLFHWLVNGTPVPGSGSTFSSTSLANSDEVQVILTSNENCIVSATALSNIISMIVNDPVPVSVLITTNSTSICDGSLTTFNAIPTNGGNSPQYQWKINGLAVGSNSEVFTTNTIVNNDQVTVDLTSNETCIINSNATSNIITMNVVPSILPSVVIDVPSTICSGQPATFSAQPVNGGGSPSFQWQVNGVNMGINSSTFTTNSLNNGDIVSVILTSSSTCAVPASVIYHSNPVTVNPTQVPSVAITASTVASCNGEPITFTAIPTNGGSTPIFQWQVNGMNAGTNSNTFTTTGLVNNSEVKVLMTSSLNCAQPLLAESNTLNISILDPQTPAVTIASSNTTICAGSAVTFNATIQNGGSSPIFQWKVNGSNVGTNSATYTTSTLSNNDQVSVVLTSNQNCITTPNVNSNVITMSVVDIGVPSVTISSSNNNVCIGSPVTFTANPTNQGANPNYQWKVNGLNVGNNEPVYTSSGLADNDQVHVELSASGCVSIPVVNSNIVTMHVISMNEPSVTISASTQTTGLPAIINATTVNAGSAILHWEDSTSNHGWQLIPTITGPTLNYVAHTEGDAVRCKLISSEFCTVPITYSNNITFTTNLLPGGIQLYPNPAYSEITISNINPLEGWRTLEIQSLTGARLSSVPVENLFTKKVNIQNLAGGIYFVVLRGSGNSISRIKFIKM